MKSTNNSDKFIIYVVEQLESGSMGWVVVQLLIIVVTGYLNHRLIESTKKSEIIMLFFLDNWISTYFRYDSFKQHLLY